MWNKVKMNGEREEKIVWPWTLEKEHAQWGGKICSRCVLAELTNLGCRNPVDH